MQKQSRLIAVFGLIALVALGAALMVVMGGEDSPNSEAAVNEPPGQVTLSESGPITPAEYMSHFVAGGQRHFLLDVRTPQEYQGGHIANSANIAVQELSSRLAEVPSDQPIIIYCRSGNRSATAARILRDAGYTNVYDLGGIIDWSAQGYPVVK